MNFVRSYRTILKQLRKACDAQPHFVNDVRVILSLGVVGKRDKSNFMPTYSPLHPSCGGKCLLVDTAALYQRCKMDLREAIQRDIAHFSGNRLPLIAAHILYHKELKWISRRLENIMHPSTSNTLSELRKISEGPNEEDFIPDSFFDPKKNAAEEPPVLAAVSPSLDKNNNGEEGVVLYSAGAIGYHRELVVQCNREKDFPLMHSFLGSSIIGSDSFSERYTQEKCFLNLIHSTQYSLKSSFETVLEDVKVKVEVLPFDAEYKNKSEAGVGQFSTAHRQFYAHISLFTLNEKVAHIANVHFFRLEMSSKDLIEDVGYLDFPQTCGNVEDRLAELGLEDSMTVRNENDTPGEGARGITFKVAFKASTDGPTVLKGILYYKCAESSKVLRERSMEALTFGPVMYHC